MSENKELNLNYMAKLAIEDAEKEIKIYDRVANQTSRRLISVIKKLSEVNDCVIAAVDLQRIWKTRNECAYNQRGDYPDNVMIHPKHKSAIYTEAHHTAAFEGSFGQLTHCFGMLVVWTDVIKEDDVICTYNGR